MAQVDRSPAAALLLGIAIVASALILSGTWKDHQRAQQTLDVSGSAEKPITSDLGIFRCTLTGEGSRPQAAFSALEAQKPTLLSYLQSKGFSGDQVKTYPANTWSMNERTADGRDTGRVLKYVYSQRFEIDSSDVNLIEAISTEVGSLVEQNVYVQTESPEYHYTKLADIKAEVQEAAARDAMERARRIAEASGAKLGTIRKARMGVLQITPRNSTMISDYGVNDVSSIEKEITAVAHASFSLE
ncbi:MAG: SIMPL domain-containing protein [Candidatus Eisenbacteria bacterium]|uniref:SIMPL domain-containing protein n=1 Tax=Eiseniibacteriota bacterium TaxID=2212470 RepID=A0A956LY94_UNCEI|nr:SIMPL domain-containing protein [Candidatus Eisenbacteria bacterium]